jgi:dTDP-4-dehydrorhamnose 3,5-epimerase
MTFKDGPIKGLVVKELVAHKDARGWLSELFRNDEIDKEYAPAMAYISSTSPGVTRGPHEHREQADLFCFVGPGTFRITCWDNRKRSSTYRNMVTLEAGENGPLSVLVPPGVVHGYKNISDKEAWVINLPNKLYKGKGKKKPVDEIRHEHDPHSPFTLE